jgi:hypothetical protein
LCAVACLFLLLLSKDCVRGLYLSLSSSSPIIVRHAPAPICPIRLSISRQFVRPLYRELLDAPIPGARELAVGTFAAFKDGYHPICRKMVAADIDKHSKARLAAAAKTAERPTAVTVPASKAAPPQATSEASLAMAMVAAGFGAGLAAVIALAIAKRK